MSEQAERRAMRQAMMERSTARRDRQNEIERLVDLRADLNRQLTGKVPLRGDRAEIARRLSEAQTEAARLKNEDDRLAGEHDVLKRAYRDRYGPEVARGR